MLDADDQWQRNRYLLSFAADSSDRYKSWTHPRVTAIETHAYVMPLDSLAKSITDGDNFIDNEELIALNRATNQRIASRLPHQQARKAVTA